MRFARNFEELADVLEQMLTDKAHLIEEEIDIALDIAAEDILTEATLLVPVDQTGLKQSLTKVKEDHAKYLVGSDLVYAAAIEYGSPPHKAPMDPIQEWAERKGIGEHWFKVWLSIKNNGTKAHPYLRPAYHKYQPGIKTRISDAINRGLENG
jgi:hypothetical protein